MKRRDFLRRAATRAGGAAVAVAGLAGCAPKSGDAPNVRTRTNVIWRMVSSFPRSIDTIFGGCEVVAARVAALTEGRFQIHPSPAGEIVPALQVLDAVQQGTVQSGQSVSYYFVGKNPALAFDACVPFGLTSRQQSAWLYEQGGLDLLRPLFADFNVLNFPAGNTGTQMGGWFKREVNSLADLKGLKMRIPGLGGQVMDRLGVVVQVLAGGDIFPALERGAIDATEWVGPYDDEKLGFHKVAPYYYYPGWWEPGPNLSMYVNRSAWDALPKDYQAAFEAACYESNQIMQARYDALNPAALTRLIAAGVQVRPFSDDVLRAAADTAEALGEEQAAKDPAYRAVWESWKTARKEAFGWFATAEQVYGNFAFARGR
jgi:TRAP-type mannitol/chloroaromatic compound transport system substrate-binding protein